MKISPLNNKNILVIIVTLTLLILTQSVHASMRCGTHVISEGKRKGHLPAEVQKKCGPPHSKAGNSWMYIKGNSVYRLRFSENSGLVSIQREIAR